MVIDAHTHIFPDALAARALSALLENSGDYETYTDATLAGLLASMDSSGVDCAWIANIATRPSQAASILAWSRTIESPRIVPLASVHPKSESFEEDIDRFREAGFRGMKLHPMYQDFVIDDPALSPFFRTIEESGMFLLLHAGYDIGFAGDDNAAPRRIGTLLERHPDLTVIAAHFGGWNAWDEASRILAGTSCYLDTSFVHEVPPRLRDEIISRFGAGRLLFATDSPWLRQDEQLERVRSLGFGADDLELVLSKNALSILESHGRRPDSGHVPGE